MSDTLTRQFLTVKEVADLLKIGEVTARHWIKGGELRAIDVGREWRIAPGDLEHFLQRHAIIAQRNRTTPQQAGVALRAEEREGPPRGVKKISAGKDRVD